MAKKQKPNQEATAGENAVIVQAGRDAILQVNKSSPKIRLVKITIEDNDDDGGLKQDVNVILKNNGDTTAFLLNGHLVQDGKASITYCNHIGMKYSLSKSDWTYDVNIDEPNPEFIGRHSIAPNEVVNFSISIGREEGFEWTVYRCHLRLDFDEGDALVTDKFFLKISGPTVWQGGYQAQGPTPDEWGRCQAENIRRLDRIGYDYRPSIDPDSRQYVEVVAPGIFDEAPTKRDGE